MAHFFTPEEANKRLPEVRKLASQISELKKSLDAGSLSDVDRRHALEQFSTLVTKLSDMGIELKDPDSGLLDFPAMKFAEPVYLCWKLGEDEILYWHGLTEGFRGRKLLRPEPAQVR
jgi:hypothetical protein